MRAPELPNRTVFILQFSLVLLELVDLVEPFIGADPEDVPVVLLLGHGGSCNVQCYIKLLGASPLPV